MTVTHISENHHTTNEPGGARRRDVLRSPRFIYPLIGLLIGFGAPVGAFLIRYVLDDQVRLAPLREIDRHLVFYLYNLIGTCLAFALAGFVAGGRAERLRRAEAFYHDLSERDPLTGLFNARALRERYARMIERAIKFRRPIALLLFDVDHLKEINDREGHAVGDAALRHVAVTLRAAKRDDDVAARWGGDEFALLLDGGDLDAAKRVADDVLHRLREGPLRQKGRSVAVTTTIGAAAGVPRTTYDDFFVVADRALYEGKTAGRDRLRAVEIM